MSVAITYLLVSACCLWPKNALSAATLPPGLLCRTAVATSQVQELQQTLALIDCNPLLALPEAAEHLQDYTGADIVRWVLSGSGSGAAYAHAWAYGPDG